MRLSDELTKQPLSAKLHEEAALLVGSFALREADLDFMDTRRALNAMSAHLALARAATAVKLTACGRLAEAVLCSLIGRQTDAIAMVDLIQQRANQPNELSVETAQRWARALKIYNSGDYRLLDQPDKGSLLEQLEYFRALRYRVNSEAASAFAEKNSLERLAEWSARVMAGATSVGDGHLWAGRALTTELEECAAAYRNYHGQSLARDNVASALNARWRSMDRTDTGETKLRVLGWGAWAELYQRELCESVETMFYWLDQMLGVPEDAQHFKQEITKGFSGLRLFALISFKTDKPSQNTDTMTPALRDLFTRSRSEITYACWDRLLQQLIKRAPVSEDAKLIVNMQSWFEMSLLPGTLYDLDHREDRMLNTGIPEIEHLKQLAPYNSQLLFTHLSRATKFHPTAEETLAQFNELSGYDVCAMRIVADSIKDQPDRYEQVFERICEVDPNRYVDLGDYLRQHNNDVGAARAYQNAFDRARDRVRISNTCNWLVNYYYDHGRKEVAFRIAREAATVYSSAGLETMAALLERTDDFEQAEEYYRKIDERYDGQHERAAFYLRNQSKSLRYAEALRETTAKLLPDGIQIVDFKSLDAAPIDGILITQTSAVMQNIGIFRGDVLVALDGRRIRNKEQYYFFRDGSKDPNISYIVWRGGHYVQVAGNIPDRRLGGLIDNYLGH
jgi:hypothetical protein